jgi:HEAT repeat protein
VTLLALAQEYKMLKHTEMLRRTFVIARLLDIALPVEILLAGLSKLQGRWSLNDVTYLLGRLGENAPLEALLDMVCHPLTSEDETRLAATNVLLQLASFVPAEPIFATLQDVDTTSELYEALVCLLIRCGAPVKSEFLLNALKGKGRDESDILMNALINLGEQAPLEDLLCMWSDRTMRVYNMDRWFQWVAEKILKSLYGVITVRGIKKASSHSVEDEHIALVILGIMGKNASMDSIKSIMDDERRDHWLRKEARYMLNDAGVVLPPYDFVTEEDLSFLLRHFFSGMDFDEIASIRELEELQPLIQELLAFLSSHRYDFDGKTEREIMYELAPSLSLEAVVVLLDHYHPGVRKLATCILAAFAERAPINKLIAMLQNPEEGRMVRIALIEALGELHLYTPAEVVTTVLSDPDQKVREAAFASLRMWGKNIPLESLLALVNDVRYPQRAEAIRALGWLQERAPLDLLFSLLKSESKDDSRNALVALSCLGKDVPLDSVISYLFRHEFAEVRSTVLRELATSGEDLSLAWLLPALDVENDDDNDIDVFIDNDMRSNIIERLGDFADAAPMQFVALAKDDVRPPVRVALMKALAKRGQDAPSELVLAALEDPQTEVREQARLALLELNIDPVLIPLEPLLAALQEMNYGDKEWPNDEYLDDDEDAHKTELALLAKCGTRVPVAPLLASLGNFDPYVCVQAASALSQTHPEVFGEVAQQAEAILRGEPTAGFFASRVQSRIARRVYRMGCATPEVLALISDLLDWPYWPVRRDAAWALGSVHRNIPDQAIRRLLELRHDPESQAVREAADEALTEILSRESGMEDE